MSGDEKCPSNPNTGAVYHCGNLRCPVHGERNREEYRRMLGTCPKCGSQRTADLFKGVYCPRCNDWC